MTRISSSSVSSIAVPQIILACGEIRSVMICAQRSASPSVRLFPPTTLISAPLASLKSRSRSGEWRASKVASSARPGPDPAPRPIIATPEPELITAFRSSKSRLTIPSRVSSSVTPIIERTNNSSPTLKALARGKSFTPSISNNFSLGITRIVSQCSRSLSRPHSAFSRRVAPSELNG